MTQRSIILRKKLHELEFDLFHLPKEPDSGQHHQIIVDDFQHRFIFLKNLLSAEIASQPHNADQLEEIEEKLAEVEAAFRGWDDHQRSALAMENYLEDTLSVCSDCALTLFNDGDLAANSVRGSDGKFRGFWWEMGRYCCVFGSGIFMGAICVIGLWSGSVPESFLLPPT